MAWNGVKSLHQLFNFFHPRFQGGIVHRDRGELGRSAGVLVATPYILHIVEQSENGCVPIF